NVDPAVVDEALTQVLERLQFPWKRYEDRVYIGPRPLSADSTTLARSEPRSVSQLGPADGPGEVVPTTPTAPAAPSVASSHFGTHAMGIIQDLEVLVLQGFPAMRHVTLRWSQEDETIRGEVEADLRRVLAEVWTTDNP